MNLDDLFEIVVLLYFVGRWVRNAVGGRRRSEPPPKQARPERQGGEAPATTQPADGGDASPGPFLAGVQGLLQKLVDDAVASAEPPEPDPAAEPVFEPLLRRALLLRGRAGQMLAEGGRRPAFEPVRRVVEGRLLPELDALRGRLGAAGLRMEDGTATDEDWGLLEDADIELRHVANRLSHLATWWLSRHDSAVGVFFDEADRLASGLFADFGEFVIRRGLELPEVRPFCVFGDSDVAQARMFADTACAPFPLPDGAPAEPGTWAAFARGVGHAFLLRLPDLEREASALVAPHVRVEAWFSEVLVDAIATALLGPAYVRSVEAELASPERPDDVVVAEGAAFGDASEVPPAHLRMRFMTALLGELGLAAEASPRWAAWDALHGSPEVLWLPDAGGGHAGYDLAPFLVGFEQAAAVVSRTPLSALSEYRLTRLPGLSFSKREVSEMRELADAFRRGEAPRAPVRTAVAAAGWVALDAAAGVAPEALWAMVGRSCGFQGDPVATRRPATAAVPDRRTELVEAWVLAEALVTPPLALRGSTSWPCYPRP